MRVLQVWIQGPLKAAGHAGPEDCGLRRVNLDESSQASQMELDSNQRSRAQSLRGGSLACLPDVKKSEIRFNKPATMMTSLRQRDPAVSDAGPQRFLQSTLPSSRRIRSRFPTAAPQTANGHATCRLGPAATSSGRDREHSGFAKGHRGWNAQPLGGFRGLGISPTAIASADAPPREGTLAMRDRV